jgi:hypothetical protein
VRQPVDGIRVRTSHGDSQLQDNAERLTNHYLATVAIEELTLHRSRSSHIDADLLGEPAWNILLDLFVARIQGREIMVTSACIASCAPQTTALRYVSVLEQRGLISRRNCELDGRMQFLELTEGAFEKIRRALAAFAEVRHGASPAR